jgi:hypothetical protein
MRLSALAFVAACSYILPATWRSFRADPDDAAPAITRALDVRHIQVEVYEAANRKIITGWQDTNDGVNRSRQRFVITWELEESDKALTIYVRHEAQDEDIGEGRPTWGGTYHDTSREADLLDQITAELQAMSRQPT